MEMRKVLIAENSEEFVAVVENALKEHCQVQTCVTGTRALELLHTYRPDVFIMDVMLPELDGISLLQAARDEGVMTDVLALTRSRADYIINSLDILGARYIMMKPVKIDALIQRVLDMFEEGSNRILRQQMRRNVTNLLLALRFPTQARGYCCTQEAVLQLMKDPDMSFSKELYPAVARICDGNPKQVERAIGRAIEAAWNQKDDAVWQQYFRPCADGTIPKPSNAAFLSRISTELILEQNGYGK